MDDQPYFLTLIDAWYSDRVNKALTPKAEIDLYASFLIKFGSADPCECHKNNQQHLVEAYKAKCSTLFSCNHEKHLFTINNPNILLIPQINPQLQPDLTSLLETGSKFNVFADLVGLATKDNLDDLPKEAIDSLFIRAYKDSRSFTKLYLRYCERTINLLELVYDNNNPFVQQKPENLNDLKRNHSIDKVLISYINRISLSDLKR